MTPEHHKGDIAAMQDMIEAEHKKNMEVYKQNSTEEHMRSTEGMAEAEDIANHYPRMLMLVGTLTTEVISYKAQKEDVKKRRKHEAELLAAEEEEQEARDRATAA